MMNAQLHSLVCFLLGILLSSGLTGCQGGGASPSHGKMGNPESWVELKYDAGDVLAGDEITHNFTLENDLPVLVRIGNDSAIVPSCYCSNLAPDLRELAPGQKTSISVKLATGRLIGKITHGGRITWMDAKNEAHTAAFWLHATVRPPMILEPATLVFNREHLAERSWQDLKIVLDREVDAKSLSVAVTSDKEFAVARKSAEGNILVYSVKCLLPIEAEEASIDRALFITASANHKHGNRPVTVEAPVVIYPIVPLCVQPQSLIISLTQPENPGNAKLVLSGEALTDPEKDVESISCEDYALTWKLSRISRASTSAIIDLTIAARPGKESPPESVVQINVKGRKPVRVPITVKR